MNIKNIVGVLAFLISLCLGQSQVTILAPTNNQVMYSGEQVTIKWTPRPGGWSGVSIALQDRNTRVMDWIHFNTPNDGTFEWTVKKWSTYSTNFWIIIRDGGGANESQVSITIPNGTRPPTPVSVPIQIKPVVSVEWVCHTNHTYQLESSPNLRDWQVEYVGLVGDTNAMALFYQTRSNRFFRVYDLTPNGPQ